MRSLLELLPTQQIVDNRICYSSYSPISITSKQHLVQFEENSIVAAYNYLEKLSQPYEVKVSSIFEIRQYLSQTVSVLGPRSLFRTILCTSANFKKIHPEQYNKTADALPVKFIESDLPNKNLVILSYQHLTNRDAGIILCSENTHIKGLFVRPDYTNYFKVLEI